MKRRAFRAQRSAIGRMVRIALDMDHLRSYVLGVIADGVNKDAAAHRAIRTQRASLLSPRNFQLLKLSISRRQVKAEKRDCGSSRNSNLEEISPVGIHWTKLPFASPFKPHSNKPEPTEEGRGKMLHLAN